MLTAIIQARMASTRLPGKVLKEVLGKPILLYQLEQLKSVNQIEQIIVATTTSQKDDPLIELCERESIACFRGSEDNVLERFYQAALHYGADPIIRLTADCPLIDPHICERVISTYLSKQADADIVRLGPTFAEGLDCSVFSFKVLEEAYHNAKWESEREHVTLYIYNHPEDYRIIALKNETDDSKYRFTIDAPKDFEVVKAIIEGLSSEKPGSFTTKKVKKFLDDHPDIFCMNTDIIRNEGLSKSLEDDEVVK